jgi:protein required for attachment to host cells
MQAGWIIVANSNEVRVFMKPAQGTLKELSAFAHVPASAAEAQAKEKEAQRFAHRVAQYLRRNHLRGAFNKLLLVAPPEFLGQLRAEVDNINALRHVETDKLHKDWVQHDIRRLEEEIRAQPDLNAWPM